MTPEVKNEPLRLILSGEEWGYIHRCLRTSRLRFIFWLAVFAIGLGGVLSGAARHGEVPYEVQVDRAIDGGDGGVSEDWAAEHCRGTYRLYAGTRRTVAFCDGDPQHEAFRARLEAADRAQAFWPVVNLLAIVVGCLLLMRALIGAVAAGIAVRKYRKSRDDLTAFLGRYNRALPSNGKPSQHPQTPALGAKGLGV